MVIAVIGLGSIGHRHASNLLQSGEHVRGFDPDSKRLALLEDMGGKAAKSREEALDGAEAAIICSPNPCHREDLQAALEKRCHVLVEKPLSHTLSGLPEILAFAESKGLLVAAAMNLRFHPVVKQAKDILTEGKLGKGIWGRLLYSGYLPDWRPDQDYRTGYTTDPVSGGVIFDLIHEIDLAQHLFGAGHVLACEARTTGVIETSAEDCADLIIRHAEGLQSSLHLDYVSKNSQRYFEVQCDEGFIKGDLFGRSITVKNAHSEIIIEESFSGSFSDDYVSEIKGFLKQVKERDGEVCIASEALKALETVIEARNMAGLRGG